jgi:2-methylcitrate dehydratase PrpD
MVDMKSMNAVEYIADHASNLEYDMLPPLALKRAGQVIVDTICCALGARVTDLGKLAGEFAAATEPGSGVLTLSYLQQALHGRML